METTQQKPDPPKKPLTAFFIYKKDQMDIIRKEQNSIKLAEITKIISKNWNQSKPEVKILYERKAAHHKKHYLKSKQEYIEKYGQIVKKTKPEKKKKAPEDKKELFARVKATKETNQMADSLKNVGIENQPAELLRLN